MEEKLSFLINYSFEEQVIAYGVLGGIPQYLNIFDNTKDIYENIKTKILDKSSYLYEEPKLLLRQEVREPALYKSIIKAIATGISKLSEISAIVGTDVDKCAKYISTLIDLKIIEKVTPLKLEAKSRKSIYKIKDNFFRFWYRFVFTNKSLIEQELIDEVIENKIKPFMNEFIGEVYEEICMDYLKILNKKKRLPFIFENIGKWWGNNPYKRREEEIDIVAFDKNNILFGECKWKNQKIDMYVLKNLIEKGMLFNYHNKYYALFSKSGFTDEVINFARQNPYMLLISKFEY